MYSGIKSTKESNCGDKLPKVNWLEHESAFQKFSSQDKFLSTNFLFSLPSQKPSSEKHSEGMLSTRSVAFNFRRTDRLTIPELEKAWNVLSSNQISCKNYLRPGVTAAVQKRSATVFASPFGGLSNSLSREANNINPHKSDYKSPYASDSSTTNNFSCANPLIRSNTCNSKVDLNPQQTPYASFTHNVAHHAVHNGGNYENGNCDDVIDDDILENIDVDQIIMNHYQAGGTPVASASKHTTYTQTDPASNVTCVNEEVIPTNLCENCHHGFKLGLCPEATSHLQEMKDHLIDLSNTLLDNFELSATQSENLRQERLHLKTQIQQLELYLQNKQSSEDVRYKSENLRYSSQVHSRNELGNGGGWSTPVPICSTDRPYTPLPPVEREFTPKVINVNYTEGSHDKKWKAVDFPWTKKLEANNKKVFGNISFRPNQREVINATMSGYDVFVLMPTGGGKSLTYQLPALICPGITLVVSPLVSLIQDQIMHLKQANVPAAYLSANMEWAEQQDILRELSSSVCTYKLLYVTPEKVAKSDVLLRLLDSLYSRESLARIVIDEAHCVSQWGHDFRPDYQGLGILKQKFPNTPVLALTATATSSVKEDVVQALGLENCIVFSQSFNRSNLWYSLIPKTKKCLEDIDKFIKDNHYDECGIIYCLSRMDCEKVAEKLQELGHKAAFYHASMDPAQRAHVQNQWSKDEINIICATIAFGMGINKPDVRFVIHHSLPKSIEGYHQECGRAGRDGLRSSCALFYSYSDYIRVKHMLIQGAIEQNPLSSASRRYPSTDKALETNIENLLRMVNYCENDVDCRRFLQLLHFGENFNPVNCQKTCDNCMKVVTWIEKDVTNIANQLVELVKLTGQKHSSTHILEVFRGSLSSNVKKYKHNTLNLHGAGKHLAKNEASRIMHHLVVEEIFVEDVKKSDFYGSLSAVLKVNESKACKLRSGQQPVVLKFPASTKPIKMTPAKASLLPETTSLPQADANAQAQNAVDLALSAKLYSSLRMLRTIILKESGDGVMAYHIFGNATLELISKRIPKTKDELLEINGIGNVKVSKYGDRILDTIACTIREYNKGKNNSSGGSSGDKRRRELTDIGSNDYSDDFDHTTFKSKKQTKKTSSTPQNYVRCIDLELDECDQEFDISVSNPNQRVLPKWSKSVKKGSANADNLFSDFMFRK